MCEFFTELYQDVRCKMRRREIKEILLTSLTFFFTASTPSWPSSIHLFIFSHSSRCLGLSEVSAFGDVKRYEVASSFNPSTHLPKSCNHIWLAIVLIFISAVIRHTLFQYFHKDWYTHFLRDVVRCKMVLDLFQESRGVQFFRWHWLLNYDAYFNFCVNLATSVGVDPTRSRVSPKEGWTTWSERNLSLLLWYF